MYVQKQDVYNYTKFVRGSFKTDLSRSLLIQAMLNNRDQTSALAKVTEKHQSADLFKDNLRSIKRSNKLYEGKIFQHEIPEEISNPRSLKSS